MNGLISAFVGAASLPLSAINNSTGPGAVELGVDDGDQCTRVVWPDRNEHSGATVVR